MVIMEFLFIYLFCDFRRGVSLHSCEMWMFALKKA